MLEHLERGHQVVLGVGAIERAVVADAHFVRGVDVGAAVARAGVGEPGLVGPRAAAEIEHARIAQRERGIGEHAAQHARHLAQHQPVGLPEAGLGPASRFHAQRSGTA